MENRTNTLPLPVGSEPFSLPIEHPDPSSTPAPLRVLTTEQEEKVNKLIEHFNSPNFSLPLLLKDWKPKAVSTLSKLGSMFSSKPVEVEVVEVEKQELNELEKMYLSREAFIRVLRSRQFDYDASLKRLEETIVWRRDFGVENLLSEEKLKNIRIEGESGKEIVCGFDLAGRPVLYMHPSRQNTLPNEAQIDFVVFCLERALDLAPATNPATDTLALCIDFGSNIAGTKPQATPMGTAQKVLNILQTYYCERLAKAVCVNIPFAFQAFFKVIGPFIDPITKEKIAFLPSPDATHLIPSNQLQQIFGGSINLEFNAETYFPALITLCQERKAANLIRWKKYGGDKCGLSETVVSGAVVPE